jgi:4,5-DOPA dioxygenase extradiol
MEQQNSGERKSLMPVLFVGHGSPINAIEDNQWSRGFKGLAELLPRPKAVLAISAHWFVDGTHVTGNSHPKTIHDFGGFPRPLYEVEYPAPGDIALAERIVSLLGKERASLSMDWGLDHGTWSVLHHLIPNADCPVVQLSIDERMAPKGHAEIGKMLMDLRHEGVLILGSGNITHNLRHAFISMHRGDSSTPEWAGNFDADIASAMQQHDLGYLVGALETDAGRICHPTPDHFFPLLYAAGAATSDESVTFPITGFDLGSLSMRAVVWG